MGTFHDGTIYLVLEDFGRLGQAYRRRTRVKPIGRPCYPICFPANTSVRSASWHSTRQRVGLAMSRPSSPARP